MSQTLVQRATPVHELLSREIINVDDFIANNNQDDDVQLISHRLVRPPLEPIVIEDSDDDVEIVAGPSRPASAGNARVERNRQIRRPSRRTLFSPSPPPQDNYIPPVPPIPPHARELPLRFRLSPEFPGPIRPLDQPLAFEQGLHGQPHLPPIRDAPRVPQVDVAEPNAVRRFNIGLGGALFALNRGNQNFEQAQPAPPPVRMEHNGGWRHLLANFGLGAYRMLFQRPDGTPEQAFHDGEDDPDLLEALALDAEERQQEARFRLFQRRALFRHANQQRRKEEQEYKPTFTHTAKPEPGFSNDFAPRESIAIRDEPCPSSVSASDMHTVLVCASCFDPLVMNVVGSEEETRRRKLFALRCGHILDGKCIDVLMKPPPEPVSVQDRGGASDMVSSSKGKGKAVIESADIVLPEYEGVSTSPSAETGLEPPPKRNKGKQRAVALEDTVSVPSIPAKRKPTAADDVEASTNYTRSRLRPRAGGSSAPGPSTATLDPPIAATSAAVAENSLLDHVNRGVGTRRRASGRRARGRATAKGKGRGKGKGKAATLVIEAVYEWSCPVANCHHKHKSVCVLGVWRMDEVEGAIAMYV